MVPFRVWSGDKGIIGAIKFSSAVWTKDLSRRGGTNAYLWCEVSLCRAARYILINYWDTCCTQKDKAPRTTPHKANEKSIHVEWNIHCTFSSVSFHLRQKILLVGRHVDDETELNKKKYSHVSYLEVTRKTVYRVI